ncbi:MAG: hypothetical protein WAU02_00795 [Candidatus Saccharimonadales bacterium]
MLLYKNLGDHIDPRTAPRVGEPAPVSELPNNIQEGQPSHNILGFFRKHPLITGIGALAATTATAFVVRTAASSSNGVTQNQPGNVLSRSTPGAEPQQTSGQTRPDISPTSIPAAPTSPEKHGDPHKLSPDTAKFLPGLESKNAIVGVDNLTQALKIRHGAFGTDEQAMVVGSTLIGERFDYLLLAANANPASFNPELQYDASNDQIDYVIAAMRSALFGTDEQDGPLATYMAEWMKQNRVDISAGKTPDTKPDFVTQSVGVRTVVVGSQPSQEVDFVVDFSRNSKKTTYAFTVRIVPDQNGGQSILRIVKSSAV